MENTPDVQIPLAALHHRDCHHGFTILEHALGDPVPIARPIVHLGATFGYVTDSPDVLQMYETFNVLTPSIRAAVQNTPRFARQHAFCPTLSCIGLQTRQPITLGEHAAFWLQDTLYNAYTFEKVRNRLNTGRLLARHTFPRMSFSVVFSLAVVDQSTAKLENIIGKLQHLKQVEE